MAAPVPLTCLGGNIHLGTLLDAADASFDSVLAVCDNDLSSAGTKRRRVETISITDESTSMILPHVDATIAFLKAAVIGAEDSKAIICCQHGQSRSLAMAVAAYLLAVEEDESSSTRSVLVKDILALMKEERPSMHINPGFVPQLLLLQDLLRCKVGSLRHSLAAARARLAIQACSRVARGAVCNGFDMIDPVAPDSEVKERPTCWVAGACGRDADPLFKDERWENIRAIPPVSTSSCKSLFRPDTFKRLAAMAEVPSVSRFLGTAQTGEAETPEPRLLISCANCRGKLCSDRNLVDIPSSILRQLHAEGDTDLPPGSYPPNPAAATITAPSTEAPYFFIEIMDWCLPSFTFPAGIPGTESSNPTISRTVAGARAKVFNPKIAPNAGAKAFMASRGGDSDDTSEPETEFSDFEPEGKLRCPCCGIKIGRYDFNGAWNCGEAFKAEENDPERIMAQAVYECRNYNFISPAFALLKETVRVVPAGGQAAPAISVVGARAAGALAPGVSGGARAGAGASAASAFLKR